MSFTYKKPISEDEFIACCQLGDMKNLSSYVINLAHELTIDKINEGFVEACKEGKLDVVRYLLTSQEMINNANIKSGYCLGLLKACTSGYLDVVEYLLLSDELKEKSEIYFYNESNTVLNLACKEGKQNIIYFLLTNKYLKDRFDFHANKDENFKRLWENKVQHIDFIHMLLKKEIIEVTEEIKKKVKRYAHKKELHDPMQELFAALEFRNKLKTELPSQPEENKRKI